MAAKFRILSVFLLLLLTFQEMIPSEAILCKAPSRFFKGLCFSNKNCAAICEEDGFISGECKGLKCVCAKDCGGGEEPPEQGGGGGVEEPPEQGGGGEETPEGPPGGATPPVSTRKSLLNN